MLTGYGADGSAGLVSIDRRGGATVVQEPEESRAPSMPESALRLMKPDYQLRIAEMAPLVNKIVQQMVPGTMQTRVRVPGCAPESGDAMINEVDSSYRENESPSGFICPECGGALWEREEDGAKKFRCRIGHAYSPESLLDAESESVESALWSAVRSLEESAAIARRVAQLVPGGSREFEQKAKEREHDAEVIRGLLARTARAAIAESQKLIGEMRELRAQVRLEARSVRHSAEALMTTMSGAFAVAVGPRIPLAPALGGAALGIDPAARGIDPKDEQLLHLLTAREMEVLRLIGEGQRTKEIAYLLGITFKTAVTHRSNIMEKLGIHEGPRLVRFAIRTGICKL